MSHIAELIAVGTELLLGNIANTDAQMISQGLSELGIHVYYHTVVGTIRPGSAPLWRRPAAGRHPHHHRRLGPTCDDLTKRLWPRVFGRELVLTSLGPAHPQLPSASTTTGP